MRASGLEPRSTARRQAGRCVRPACATWLAIAVTLAAVTPARADTGATLESFRPARTPADGFGVNGGDPGKHLDLNLQLYLDYANDPLVYEDVSGDSGTELVALVSDQLTLHMLASLGLYDVALVFLGVPLNLMMDGERLGTQLPSAQGFGAGDMLLGGRAALYRAEKVHVALQLSLTFPTGEAGDEGRPSLAGEDAVTFAPAVTIDAQAGPLSVLIDAGMRFRPDARFSGAHFRDVATFGAALAVPISERLLRAILEVEGEAPLDDIGERASTQLQALLGLRLQLSSGLGFGLAGGSGLLRGFGSPDVRGVFTVSYLVSLAGSERAGPSEEEAPEPEPEPMAAREAAAVSEEIAEPIPSDTIADGDGDGVPDVEDRCPVLPGGTDVSGCPNTLRYDDQTGTIELLQPVRFADGRAQLRGRSNEVLTELAAAMAANPRMRMRVEAHVSRGRGNPNAALQLSVERAEAFALKLIALGVGSSRLDAMGCGANRPLVPDSGSQRYKNERVELFVVDPLPPSGMRSSVGCSDVALPEDRTPQPSTPGTAPSSKPITSAAPTAVPPAPKPAPAAAAPKPAPQPAPTPVPASKPSALPFGLPKAPVVVPPPPAVKPPPPAVKPPPPAAPPPAAKPAPKVGLPAAAAGASAIAVLGAVAADPGGDADRDGVANAKDECPLAPGAKGTPPGCPPGHKLDLENGRIELIKPLRFDDGESTLSGRSDELLDELAATLKANPKMTVAIEAHTGEDANPDATSALTRKRAMSVRKALASRGIAPTRMTAYGCGQNRPIAPNNVPWGRKKNERIELHVLDPAPSSAVHSPEGCIASE